VTEPAALDRIAGEFARIAAMAGRAVMSVYTAGATVTTKGDGSPVTEADAQAEAIILDALARGFPGIPVIAEEAASVATELPACDGDFILVDPLDGTREFIKRNGEFTINIALISNRMPIAGVVYAPVAMRMYMGGETARECKWDPAAERPSSEMQRLATRSYPVHGLSAAVSRSHPDAATKAFLDRLPLAEQLEAGSSLKFCRMAAGAIDVYPRFGPTMEWDTAAGHAVLRAAGGCIVKPDGSSFLYGKSSERYRNGAFVAWGREAIVFAPAMAG
jgi:3'(2'), 5'-bisphosphate nucleotidase